MRKLILLWCGVWMAGVVLAEDMQYTFRPGDSLWRVCETFARDPNLCWQELAQHNNISSPRAIPPGAILNIPIGWLKQEPEPARVQALVGDVSVYRSDGAAAEYAQPGMEVKTGDALETGDRSSARVLFADQSELLIKPESLVIFDRYSRFRDTGMVDTSLRLERGELRTYVRPRNSGSSRFIIVTPSAAAAVRGTRFDVEVDQEEVTRNIVLNGSVTLSAEGQAQQVDEGFSSTAAPGEPPTKPAPILPATSITVEGVQPQVRVSWAVIQGAERYWIELYRLPDQALLMSEPVAGRQWQGSLAEGDYELVVRAVDSAGIRGYEAMTAVQVQAPSIVEEKPDTRGFWLFIIGATLILTL